MCRKLGLCFLAIELSGYQAMKRKSAVLADWDQIFTDGKIVGCELWDGRGRFLPTDFHGLARMEKG